MFLVLLAQLSLESPHQPPASRFATEGRHVGFKPRPPGSSSGSNSNSSSSTPQSSCPGNNLPPHPHPPHPPQLARKASIKANSMPMAIVQEHLPQSESPAPQAAGDGPGAPRFRRRSSFLTEPTKVVVGFQSRTPVVSGGTSSGVSNPASPTTTSSHGHGFHGDEQLFRTSSMPTTSREHDAATDVPVSRPGSGRNKAVQMLVDAVRSKDDQQLEDTLAYLTMPNGGIAGLNDRHPVTGRSALHEAVTMNNVAMVHRLLAAGGNPSVEHPQQGGPVLQAAGCGQPEALEALLHAGANIDAHDMMGWTALHHACASGHVNTAR